MHSTADETATATSPAARRLARVVHDVVSAPDLEQALEHVVGHVRGAMGVEICELYLCERPTDDHVLLAGSRLSAHLVGHPRFRPAEGLIGRMAERAARPRIIANSSRRGQPVEQPGHW
jgi:signal transduction protein with GAF and PtsI domain